MISEDRDRLLGVLAALSGTELFAALVDKPKLGALYDALVSLARAELPRGVQTPLERPTMDHEEKIRRVLNAGAPWFNPACLYADHVKAAEQIIKALYGDAA